MVQQLGRAGTAAGALAGRLRGVWAPVGAMIGAAGLGGLVGMVRGAAAGGAASYETSRRLGIAVRDLSRYRYLARMTGVDSEQVEQSMSRLNRTVADAASGRNRAARGRNRAAIGLFQQLHIPLRDANGQMRSSADVMLDLAEAFKRNESPALRTQMAMALFGRSGVAMIPMLERGRDGLTEMIEEGQRLGLVSRASAAEAEANAPAPPGSSRAPRTA